MSKKKTTKTPTVSKGKDVGPMDVALLQQIVDLMAANDLNTVDLRDGSRRVVLKRGPAVPIGGIPMTYAPAVPGPAAPPSAIQSVVPAPEAVEANLIPIKSPMVGTFYMASSPDAKPFVTVGAKVDEETDVCVIEAMKVFNAIKAECRGTIARINVENGAPVEFGQVLFLVKP